MLALGGRAAADDLASKKIYPETLHATVWLMVPGNVQGTGWVVDRAGLVITNHHVMHTGDSVDAYFPLYRDGRAVNERNSYLGKVPAVYGRLIDSDPRNDLALLQLESIPDGVKELKLAAETALPGETVHTVGNPAPNGMSDPLWKYTGGTVGAVSRQKLKIDGVQDLDAVVVETQAPINPGDSGGPVVNSQGELVAVNSNVARGNNINPVTYAVDVQEVKKFVAQSRLLLAPHTAADYRKRGLHYAGRLRNALAIDDFTQVLRLDPKDASAYYQRALALKRGKAYERAIADFVQAVRLNPTNADAYLQRGLTYLVLSEYDQAGADLTRALDLKTSEVVLAKYHRGQCWRQRGEWDKALADIDEVVRLLPKAYDAHNERGLILLARGDADGAIEEFDKAIALEAGYDEAFLNRGDAYMKKGDAVPALESYDAATKVNAKYVVPYVHRAAAYSQAGEFDKAIAECGTAIGLLATYAPAYRERGVASLGKGNVVKALDDLTRAIRLAPGDASAYRERRRRPDPQRQFRPGDRRRNRCRGSRPERCGRLRSARGGSYGQEILASGGSRLRPRHRPRSQERYISHQPGLLTGRERGSGAGHRRFHPCHRTESELAAGLSRPQRSLCQDRQDRRGRSGRRQGARTGHQAEVTGVYGGIQQNPRMAAKGFGQTPLRGAVPKNRHRRKTSLDAAAAARFNHLKN